MLRKVSEHIGERLGSALQFPAIFAEDAAAEDGVLGAPLSDPFASVALTVLRSVGGRYREIAERLSRAPDEIVRPGLLSVEPAGFILREQGFADPSPISTISKGGVTVPVSDLPTPNRPPTLWRGVPSKNPNFTGREDLLLALRSQLGRGRTVLVPIALHGLGGVGKSQVAVEYAYRFANDYDLVCWVSGEGLTQLREDMVKIAPDLGIPAGDEVEATLNGVRDALRRGEPFSRRLLVVDNADRPEEFLPYLPPSGGHTLITSRNQMWRRNAFTFEVPVFSREESISLIKRHASDISDEDADRLADRLGDLPLAVEQAAAWQADSGMSVDRYLSLLDERVSILLKENPPPGYSVDIVAAWTLAYEHLEEQAPEAAALVELCSFLGPEPISYSLLWAFRRASGLTSALESMLQDELHFSRAVRQVGQYALLQVDPSSETLTEHRLVQAVLREWLGPERREQMVRLVWQLMVAANPGRPDDTRNWDMLSNINRHLRPSGILDADDKAARVVILDQIRYLFSRGDNASSQELAEDALSRWEVSPGPDDEQTLIASRLLGIALREAGHMEKAREINANTYERARAVYSEDNEHYLITANSYACDLRTDGNYPAALELDRRLYELHRRVFRDYNENTFRSAHNLAIDMRLNGLYAEALELDMMTLARRRETLGDNRWETWSSAGAVARDLRSLGDYTESYRRLEEAIAACKRLLGADHREVVRLRTDSAMTLRRLGRFDEAQKEAAACLDIYLRRLGLAHSYTLSAKTILAEVMRLLGSFDQALELAAEVAEAAPITYGEGHVLVTTCEHNYAIKLRCAGDVNSAYAIDRRISETFHDKLGQNRRRTINSEISLALDLAALGSLPEAQHKLRNMHEKSKEIRGADHPRTHFIAMNLARVTHELHEDEEAERIRTAALSALRAYLGADHREVQLAQSGSYIDFEIEIPDR